MINEKQIESALGISKKFYTELREVLDLTAEIDQGLKANDNVTLRMLLSMRREHVNNLVQYDDVLNKMCNVMDKSDSEIFKNIISAKQCTLPIANALFEQTGKNKALLNSVIRADKALSKRFGNDKSFYMQNSKP